MTLLGWEGIGIRLALGVNSAFRLLFKMSFAGRDDLSFISIHNSFPAQISKKMRLGAET